MSNPSSRSTELDHVRWIGGGSGAGKSTIARRLADAHDVVLYDTDAAMSDHARRCRPADAPFLHDFTEMSMDERWVRRSPETMLETFHWFRGEGFDLIVEDLMEIGVDRPVIAEGFRLLPRLIAPLLRDRADAIWLLPTPLFRRHAFTIRGTIDDIPERTSDPRQALRNILRRDELFTEGLRSEIERARLTAIDVDVGCDEPELVTHVAERFGLVSLDPKK